MGDFGAWEYQIADVDDLWEHFQQDFHSDLAQNMTFWMSQGAEGVECRYLPGGLQARGRLARALRGRGAGSPQ